MGGPPDSDADYSNSQRRESKQLKKTFDQIKRAAKFLVDEVLSIEKPTDEINYFLDNYGKYQGIYDQFKGGVKTGSVDYDYTYSERVEKYKVRIIEYSNRLLDAYLKIFPERKEQYKGYFYQWALEFRVTVDEDHTGEFVFDRIIEKPVKKKPQKEKIKPLSNKTQERSENKDEKPADNAVEPIIEKSVENGYLENEYSRLDEIHQRLKAFFLHYEVTHSGYLTALEMAEKCDVLRALRIKQSIAEEETRLINAFEKFVFDHALLI